MKKQGRPSRTSMIGIFDGFECMTDTDTFNKVKHKNNNTKLRYGLFKVKLSIYL